MTSYLKANPKVNFVENIASYQKIEYQNRLSEKHNSYFHSKNLNNQKIEIEEAVVLRSVLFMNMQNNIEFKRIRMFFIF